MDILEKHTVMQFDICSSSTIIQELIVSENTEAWRNLLLWIERYLIRAEARFHFHTYKFVGDGWILFFDFDPGSNPLSFAKEFSRKFSAKIEQLTHEFLDDPPEILGLTFGVDRGTLVRLNIMRQEEWIGWAINVAARLEKARNGDKTPQYKMLITKSVYKDLKKYIVDFPAKHVTRRLKNISRTKTFRCVSVRVKELCP